MGSTCPYSLPLHIQIFLARPPSEAWLKPQSSSYTGATAFHRLLPELSSLVSLQHLDVCAHSNVSTHGGVSGELNGTFLLTLQNLPPRPLLPSSFHNFKRPISVTNLLFYNIHSTFAVLITPCLRIYLHF